MNNLEFIDRANKIHKNNYDYSLVEFKSFHSKIRIICFSHGIFQQDAGQHLRGYGCKVCGHERSANSKRITTEEFIAKAHSRHGLEYDYSLSKYVDNKTPIIIVCKQHGEFLQIPNSHLNGKGCIKCGGTEILQQNEFVLRANKIHKNIYDYSNTIYRGNHHSIDIICSVHGVFSQDAGNHLRGQGCPRCAAKSISRKESTWLDSFNILNEYRQRLICIDDKRIKVDAYDPKTNTVYEFWGDFWHGNPEIFEPTEINPMNKKTYGELYEQTQRRRTLIMNAGYNLIEIWESDLAASIHKALGID